jgi:D-alanyl-D-alanine carboxypeptidase/D-alanyl-D-alanine-endopeptidase (penicillin-binding protein 4)
MKTRHSLPSRHSLTSSALLLLVVVCLFIAAPQARGQSIQSRVAQLVRGMDLGKASMSLQFVDVSSGDEIASVNATRSLIPASNMKIVTTAAAMVALGEDFVFHTELRLAGKTLIIKGDGDPAFGDPIVLGALGMSVDGLLGTWVEAVRTANVGAIDQIIVDDRIFDQQMVHPNWPENQLHKWYCAQVAGINFNDNCLNIYASPTRPGLPPTIVLEPAAAPILLDNGSVTGNSNAFWAARRLGTNQFILRGEVKHALLEPIYVTVHDPPLFVGQAMGRMLTAAGIPTGDARRVAPEDVLPESRLIASVQTSLPTVLVRCNRDSQNLFAEALLKRIGHRITGQPGSWSNGSAAIRMFLTKVLAADAASVAIDDGSGMSRNNRISAAALTKILSFMVTQPRYAAIYRDSFAAPGSEGTLDKRFRSAKLNGQLRAKSGYISGVVSLSGYLSYDDGRVIAFSMILNNYDKGVPRAKEVMEKIIYAVDEHVARDLKIKLGG